MVAVGELIVVLSGERAPTELEALVLGVEDAYVWLYCTDSREIYRSNPNCIMEHKGRKILFQYDDCRPRDDVFDDNGECDSGVFWHASEAVRVRMTKLLKTWRLIDP